MKLKKKFSALRKGFTLSKSKAMPAGRQGFTLIELLVVMGIIAILVAVVAIAVNPGRQFANARDTTRRSHLRELLSAVYQYAAQNNGNVPSVITSTPTTVGTNTGLVNLETGLIPNYLDALPTDPSTGTRGNTGYVIFRNGNRITASATGEISVGITQTQ